MLYPTLKQIQNPQLLFCGVALVAAALAAERLGCQEKTLALGLWKRLWCALDTRGECEIHFASGVGSLFSCLKEENVVSGCVDLITCCHAVAELLHVLPPACFQPLILPCFLIRLKKKKKSCEINIETVSDLWSTVGLEEYSYQSLFTNNSQNGGEGEGQQACMYTFEMQV